MPAQNKSLNTKRHSLAHLLAMAVRRKHPDIKFGMGPVVENGFYYDFDFSKIGHSPSQDCLPKLEKAMRELMKKDIKFERQEIKAKEAKKIFAGQPFKLELINELEKTGEKILIYKSEDFIDLCAGPHVKSTEEINSNGFKLTKIAGAYWKGSEKNPMLTRIYGVAFETKKELDDYLKMMEEAEKRDHRKIGKDLELFAFDEDVGPGLPLWLPKGTIIINELEKLAKETELKSGYFEVRTPHIAKESMYLASGHLPYYKDAMFPPMEYEGTKYYLKAMNCPHHHKIFSSKIRSYKELPLRLAEYGTVYRHEKSGELFGLMRVRMLQMNDAHIYCSEEQFAEEFKKVNEMYLNYFKIFGIKKYIMRFSTHSSKKLGEKYVNEPKLWKKTEDMTRKILMKTKIPYVEIPDEAAFYGPKIDVQVWSAIGREFTLATNQVDFAVPKRFNLKYIDSDGKEKTPLCIHRAPLGTHERFIGFLIEHFAGAFPLWLSPVQAAVIPVSEKYDKYGEKLLAEFKENNIRTELDAANETLGKRIRAAELRKIPYILIIGEKEVQNKTVNVRHYKRGKGDEIKIEELVEKITKEIKDKI